MAPVSYQHRVPCFVPVGTAGTMNKQRTGNTVRILERVMTVVPSISVLSRFEVICESLISSNGTLRDTVDSVSWVGIELANAVPMNRGSIIW